MRQISENRSKTSFVVTLCFGGLLAAAVVAQVAAQPATQSRLQDPGAKLAETYIGGLADEFALPVDPTHRTFLDGSVPPLGWKEFDDDRIDYWVGHTFEGLPSDVFAGELVVRMRPEAFSDNDTINFGVRPDDGFYLSSTIADLPEANGSWNDIDNDATTFTIALTNDLLDKIATDERLEMVVQDDTNVDFVELNLLRCTTEIRFSGLADEFALPVDPTNRTFLDAWVPPLGWKEFDDSRINYWVGHTFENLPNDVLGGELVVRMRPEAFSGNDVIHFGERPTQDGFFFSSTIADLPEANGSWNSINNGATTFTIALTNDLLDKIATDKRLEMLVQDDTNVDFVDLHLLVCNCSIFADGFESADLSAWSATFP